MTLAWSGTCRTGSSSCTWAGSWRSGRPRRYSRGRTTLTPRHCCPRCLRWTGRSTHGSSCRGRYPPRPIRPAAASSTPGAPGGCPLASVRRWNLHCSKASPDTSSVVIFRSLSLEAHQMPDNRLDPLRQGQGEIANHIIDEFAAGRLSRRDFIRRGTVVGISVPLLGSILAACGPSSSSSAPTTGSTSGSGSASGTPGATIKVGIETPTGAINPLTVADQGGLDMLAQTGEYLCLSGQTLNLTPVLATSWTPNSAADEWTFKIRQGVKFHNGAPLTADDVVYTYQLHTNKSNGSSALSAFGGVLSPSGVTKVDDFTVSFKLNAPNGNFPYLCSSDNYNMIILPKGYDPTKWETTFVGTGPFK